MIANKYETAVHEVESVLDEWLASYGDRLLVGAMAKAIVERLVAKGVIQSTDPDELVAPQYRTGPLAPGRKIVGGHD
jgi:hypothetical protein